MCLGASGSVRASRMPHSARWAADVHTFCPVTTHSSPSRSARVVMLARSEPASGSLNSWHHTSSPRSMGARYRSFCASVPWTSSVGPTMPIAIGEDAVGHAEARLLLVEDRRFDRPPSPAPERRRPRDAGPAALGQHALPLPAALHVHILRVVVRPHPGREVVRVPLRDGGGLEPGARLGPKERLLRSVVEVHEHETRTRSSAPTESATCRWSARRSPSPAPSSEAGGRQRPTCTTARSCRWGRMTRASTSAWAGCSS